MSTSAYIKKVIIVLRYSIRYLFTITTDVKIVNFVAMCIHFIHMFQLRNLHVKTTVYLFMSCSVTKAYFLSVPEPELFHSGLDGNGSVTKHHPSIHAASKSYGDGGS